MTDLNAAIGAVVRAEAARRGWTTDELSRRAGIPRRTMFRLVDPVPPPDREAPQWKTEQIAAVATAYGMRVSELIALAEAPSVTPPKSEDPRTLITWLLAHPEDDAELVTRLDEVAHQTALGGRRLMNLLETIRTVRREELEQALSVLPPHSPSTGRANRESG